MVERITVAPDEVSIVLYYLPASLELMAEGQRNLIPALPFCHVTLKGQNRYLSRIPARFARLAITSAPAGSTSISANVIWPGTWAFIRRA